MSDAPEPTPPTDPGAPPEYDAPDTTEAPAHDDGGDNAEGA